jgi:hypothetical protein
MCSPDVAYAVSFSAACLSTLAMPAALINCEREVLHRQIGQLVLDVFLWNKPLAILPIRSIRPTGPGIPDAPIFFTMRAGAAGIYSNAYYRQRSLGMKKASSAIAVVFQH